ncbi:DENN domain-containing protein 10-like [Salvelinus fontinalis]|uniref:DENN domain-containing protein 10-like n=1 Tax=Salvelinus fontinalis TaxID=8038 RepID=UPI002485747F|nr:DENN domain-containing protein 10-like [Salvelinus fontinalis]XP_055757911.1 DENN domain-containing protein 10-like [Salvelinus fontinalis]
MAAPETQLMLSVGLIEKDVNADTLWVWCYPSVSAELREVLLSKCCLRQDSRGLHTFVFGQFRRTWYYISTVEVQEPTALKKVTHFSTVVTAKDFNPEKYAAFSRVLCRMYIKHGSPVKMMEGYIAVLTKGICQSDENGSFLIKDYDVRKAYLAGSVKDVVSQFGMETIILYTALMLKKRIVVHHPQVEALLEFTRALPALTWHRKDWSILHPYVHLTDSELENLRTCTGYVAGFVDPEVSNRSDLFDVYVNLPDSEITISQSAKEAMSMGKLHKDIGLVIVQSAENADRTDGQIIKDISIKTREILANLASLAEECENSKITLETLKQRHFPPATENFLFHLAAAEQLLKI